MINFSDESCTLKNTFYFQELFSENPAFYEIMCERYGRAGHATDMEHALFMLDT
jgi:hypothetical protein